MAKPPLRFVPSGPRPFRKGSGGKTIPLAPSRQITDPRELYVPRPGKGSLVLSTRIEPEVMQQIEHIVQSGQTAFESKNEYARAAICYFHEYVIAPILRDKLLTKDIHYTAAKIRRAKMTARLRDFEEFANAYKDALTKLAKVGMADEVVEMWEDIKRTAKKSGEQFHRIVVKWMETDPGLGRVRRMINESKQEEDKG